jgi:hypothetical protein
MTHVRLFSQRLSANAFLTRFTDAAFQARYFFGAYHAFLFGVAHDVLPPPENIYLVDLIADTRRVIERL